MYTLTERILAILSCPSSLVMENERFPGKDSRDGTVVGEKKKIIFGLFRS